MENSNRCTKCNGKGTRSAQVLFSQIPPKQLMLGRKMRGRTRKRTQRTPRSRSKGFPSHREESDWWKCGSRSPLSFPSKTSKNPWRDRELASSKKVNNGGRTRAQRIRFIGGRRPPFYRRGKIQPLCAQPAHERYYLSGRRNREKEQQNMNLGAVVPQETAVLPLG